MYKLVVSDMDGTLLNSNHEVTEENKVALKEAIDKNVRVAIATGRIYTSAKVYGKNLGLLTPIIACNGAIVRDMATDEILYENHLEKEDVLKVIEVARKHGVYYHYYTADKFYTEELVYSSLKYSEWNDEQKEEDRIDIIIVEDGYECAKNLEEHIYKVQLISEDSELMEKVRKELDDMPTVECCKSWYNNLEVMNRGVSKASAIMQLAKLYNVDKEEIICFGDNENDITMLRYVGKGVAMDNADDYVKEHADYITKSNDESGVAHGIRKFVLN
ncbi:Cof-type HAD-IIB family hydrolase [Anaeromicrobium sediminis]|uniref:Haloacid dehalogenase n=1 Tax=Anaeromicrobium sediminis TaxID=1478221 RepID=A0A267MPZ7_9FIRM|nr:Cof-type HAD-IIB family hydrolase [Anaeromicrobium sediminis]PAB60810.1 haloacid dehalogenase [Anaeromicrobium sediminis]